MKPNLHVIVAFLFMAGCRQALDQPVPASPSDVSEPVVQYWDGGISMIGKPPFIIFAAWPDGMVVKRVKEEPMAGFVAAKDIAGLLVAVRKAGFFTPSDSHLLDTYGMVFPDGPVQCLSIDDGGKPRTLYYHGRDDRNHFDKIGPHAGPSREQSEEFVAMWKRVVAQTERLTPTNVTPFTGDRRLTYPQYIRKSQLSAGGDGEPAPQP